MGKDTKTINTDIPTKLWLEAKAKAALSDMTIKEWLIKAIKEKLDREK